MTTPAIPLIGWGAFVIAIAIFGTVQYELDLLPTLLLAGAGAGAIATGAAAGMAERRRTRRPAAPELLLRSSAATLVLTVGVTLLFVGAASVGPGVMWPGVGLMIAGAGGLLRETRAARRLRRAPATGSDA